jgi:hypothetical protein
VALTITTILAAATVTATAAASPVPAGPAQIRTNGSGECDQPTVTDDRGDGKVFDVVSHSLTSDCTTWTLTTRLAKPVKRDRLRGWFMEIRVGGGGRGCNGANRLMYAYVDGDALSADLVDTPRCDSNFWTVMDTAPVRLVDNRTLQVSFDNGVTGGVASFRWRSGVAATNSGGYDVAPNSGWTTARVPPNRPRFLSVSITDDSAFLTWQAPAGPTSRRLTYLVILSKGGGPGSELERPGRSANLGRLEPGTYTVSVQAVAGIQRSRPTSLRFVIEAQGGQP